MALSLFALWSETPIEACYYLTEFECLEGSAIRCSRRFAFDEEETGIAPSCLDSSLLRDVSIS